MVQLITYSVHYIFQYNVTFSSSDLHASFRMFIFCHLLKSELCTCLGSDIKSMDLSQKEQGSHPLLGSSVSLVKFFKLFKSQIPHVLI